MPHPATITALVALFTTASTLQCKGTTYNALFDVAPGSSRPMSSITSAANCTCASYSESTCCTDAYLAANRQGPQALYKGWSFDQCGRTMSSACRAYMDSQECSYACDPRLTQNYWDLSSPGFQSIKLCSTFCDAWFDACKNDFTCAYDWVNWVQNPTLGFVCNATPVGAPMQTCKTIGETFRNGRGLCGINPTTGGTMGMWNNLYTYDETNGANGKCYSFLAGSGPGAPEAKLPEVCAAPSSKQAPCVHDYSTHASPFFGRAPYVPKYAKSFSISYAPMYKVLNVTLGGKNYITTVSLCGTAQPAAASLQLGASDILVSQLTQPLTKLAITSTTYAPFLEVRVPPFSPRLNTPSSPFRFPPVLTPLPPPPHTAPCTLHTRDSCSSRATWGSCP